MPTYYQILSLPETASPQEIKSAFRKLSLRYHPDRNNGDKNAEAKFREVLEAYKVLSDPDKKLWYDRRLFYQRQPPPPQPQPQQPPQPVYHSRNRARAYPDEYVQPDFSRMPWKFMGIITLGLVTFFVLLYNFGPKPKSVTEEMLAEAQAQLQAQSKPISLAAVAEHRLKRQDGSFTSLLDMGGRFPNAERVEQFMDIDGDSINELHISVAYPGQEMFASEDYIFRRPEGAQDDDEAMYEEFFTYNGGMYIVGNNIRLYFDEAIESYRSCVSCRITGLPNSRMVPAIYLRAGKGKLWFADTNERRNKEITENLAYLQSLGIPELQNGQDDGTRKEYIRQIVAYYFNNRSYPATEALFRKYYPGPDQEIVWRNAETIIKTYTQKITSNAAFGNMEVL